MMEKSRDGFSSQFGVLVALAGSAVGLGNLWRFPYLMGQNGGAAFIVIYLLFVFVLCLPIFMAEFMLGKKSHVNAFNLFGKMVPGSKWRHLGIFNILAPIFILSFYCVVGGWTIKYLLYSFSFQMVSDPSVSFEFLFNDFVASDSTVIYGLVFLALTAAISFMGINKGIEKISKILMPVLFVLMIAIAIYVIFIPGSGEGYEYLFKPDFSKVTSKTLTAALGQAFFSLSIGCGTLATYASYSGKDTNILKMSTMTIISDTLFAIIAGCAIIPAVFAYGLNVGEGPGLAFVTLPYVFTKMSAGGIVAIIFFFSLLVAALTSSISLFEVVSTFAIEKFKISRKKAVLGCILIFAVLSSICALSNGPHLTAKIFGMNIFDFADYTSSNIIMTVGVLIIVLFVGWKLPRKDVIAEFTQDGTLGHAKLYDIIFLIIKYLAPVTVVLIIFSQIFSL